MSNRLEQDLISDLGFEVGGLGLELVFFSFQSVGTFRRGDFSCLLLIRKKILFSFCSIGLPTRWMTSVDGIVVVSGFVFSCGSFFSLWRCLLFFFQPPSSYLSPSPDSNLSRISLQKQSFGLGLSAYCKRKLQHRLVCFGFKEFSIMSFVLLSQLWRHQIV